MERNEDGTFAQGNEGGPGNPHAKRVNQLRSALLDAVTPEDITEVVQRLIIEAKTGDVPAARVLLDRVFGKPKTNAEVEMRDQTGPVTFNVVYPDEDEPREVRVD